MKKIVLLNGPISSGKDVLGQFLAENISNARTMMFKDCLYDWAAACAGVPKELFVAFASGRDTKEMPMDWLPVDHAARKHHSPRSWLIHVSENVIKPRLGQNFFGASSLKSVKEDNAHEVFIFTDSGFVEEALELLEFNPLVVQIKRPGFVFASNDSRNYVSHPSLLVKELHNDKTQAEFFENGLALVKEYLAC